MNETVQYYGQRRAPEIEGIEKTLLDEIFGTRKYYGERTGEKGSYVYDDEITDPANFKDAAYSSMVGGLLQEKDLFNIPQYGMAAQGGRSQYLGTEGEGDERRNIFGYFNSDGQRVTTDAQGRTFTGEGQLTPQFGLETFGAQALSQDNDGDGYPDFLGRYMPYFESAGAYTTGGGEALGRGLGTIGEGKTFFGPAAEYVSGGRGMYDPNQYVGAYMNPYIDNVVKNAESDIERQGNVARQRGAANAVSSGAFGGSRQGVQSAEIERNIADAKAKASTDLRAKAYDSALNSSMGAYKDAATRNLEAGRLMGGLGQSVGQLGSAYGNLGSTYGSLGGTAADIGRVYSALAPADLAFMSGIGADERSYRQDIINTNRQNQMLPTEQALLPYNYGYGVLSGTPSANLYSTEQRTYSPGTNAAVAGLGAYTALQGINQQSS